MYKISRWLCHFWLYQLFFPNKCNQAQEEQQQEQRDEAFFNEHGIYPGQGFGGGSRRTRITRRLTRRRNRKTRRK
jgi:hypothetical protein